MFRITLQYHALDHMARRLPDSAFMVTVFAGTVESAKIKASTILNDGVNYSITLVDISEQDPA